MVRRISEFAKFCVAVVAQALNNTNVTGRYFAAHGCRRMTFHLIVGAMAATKTAIIALYEAQDAAATGAQAISGATATITANTDVTKATVALAAVANTDVVEINGLEFTKAAATDATAREFADAAGLVTCVAHATYGVPGITATADGTTVTLVATNPDDETITLDKTENAGTITLATVEAQAFVELDVSLLSTDEDMTHVAAKVTTTANTTVAVSLLKSLNRNTPAQKVGASAVV